MITKNTRRKQINNNNNNKNKVKKTYLKPRKSNKIQQVGGVGPSNNIVIAGVSYDVYFNKEVATQKIKDTPIPDDKEIIVAIFNDTTQVKYLIKNKKGNILEKVATLNFTNKSHKIINRESLKSADGNSIGRIIFSDEEQKKIDDAVLGLGIEKVDETTFKITTSEDNTKTYLYNIKDTRDTTSSGYLLFSDGINQFLKKEGDTEENIRKILNKEVSKVTPEANQAATLDPQQISNASPIVLSESSESSEPVRKREPSQEHTESMKSLDDKQICPTKDLDDLMTNVNQIYDKLLPGQRTVEESSSDPEECDTTLGKINSMLTDIIAKPMPSRAAPAAPIKFNVNVNQRQDNTKLLQTLLGQTDDDNQITNQQYNDSWKKFLRIIAQQLISEQKKEKSKHIFIVRLKDNVYTLLKCIYDHNYNTLTIDRKFDFYMASEINYKCDKQNNFKIIFFNSENPAEIKLSICFDNKTIDFNDLFISEMVGLDFTNTYNSIKKAIKKQNKVISWDKQQEQKRILSVKYKITTTQPENAEFILDIYHNNTKYYIYPDTISGGSKSGNKSVKHPRNVKKNHHKSRKLKLKKNHTLG